MIKLIKNLLIIVYAAIAIGVTVCLLSYNDYNISEFGSYSLLIMDNKDLEPDFLKGDLLIVSKEDKPKAGDKAFFYNTYTQELKVSCTTIQKVEQISETETTYTLEGGNLLSSEYMIGSAETATQFSKVGTILSIIESRWGFLLLIVLPSLMAFLYEVIEVVKELKSGGESEDYKSSNKTKRTAKKDESDEELERIRKRRHVK